MERTIQTVAFIKPLLSKKKRVAAYARVSTGKDSMLHSLSAQVSYYNATIQSHPDWIFVGVYTDEAKTGTKENRNGFQTLLEDCRAGKIDLVITKSISRFARNTVTLLETVRELKSYGIDVFFEEQNIHTLSSEGEVMLTILASFAQEESRSASENMKWRIRQSFKEGRPWDCTLLGYRFSGDRYVIEQDEANTVRLIYDLYLSGFGIGKIVQYLNQKNLPTRYGNNWHESSVARILRNDSYTGNLTLQKTFRNDYISKQKHINRGELPKYRVEAAHEAIISQEQFDLVQKEIEQRASSQSPSTPRVIVSRYSRHIVCGICGKHYKRITVPSGHKWCCSTFFKRGKAACPSRPIPEYILDELTAGLEFETISVLPNNTVEIKCGDHTVCKSWHYPSRSESWTDEMREKARQKAKRKE